MDATATAKLALDASGLDRGLASAQDSVSRFAKQAGTALVGAFAFDKIISGFNSAIEKGDQLQDIAEKFGVSASKLQMLGNAASVFGSGLDQVSAGLNKLSLAQQKAVSGEQGAEALVATFAEVGISLEELRTISAEDIFLKIADSFSSGANDGRQFVIVNELLGKAQTDLIKVLNQGSEAIIEQGNAIGVFSNETIAQLSAASDSIKKFQNILTVGFGTAAAKIMEAVEAYGRFAVIKPIIKFFDETKQQPQAKKPIRQGDLPDKAALQTQKKEQEKIAKEEATQELKLIEARISGEEAAKKILADFEEKEAKDKLKRDKDRADELADYKKKLAEEEDAAKRRPRLEQQARGFAATEVLDFASGLGDRGISQIVQRERDKAASEQQKISRKEFDAKVVEQTSATTGKGLKRTLASRRQEFIQKEAGKEAKGEKTLADIYQVLNDALTKITAAPMVT
jgi:hypothetical protein